MRRAEGMFLMAIWATEKEAWDFSVRVVRRFLASDAYLTCGRHNHECATCEGLGYCIDQAMSFKEVGKLPQEPNGRCLRVPAKLQNQD